MITKYRGANGHISQGKRLSYSDLQGIWALVQNKGCSQKQDLVTLCAFTSTCETSIVLIRIKVVK